MTTVTSSPSSRSLWPLALAAALLPVVTTHLCFLVSAWQGHIDWCLPYWEGCSSISRAGRHGLAYFLFKGGMIPACVLLAAFWWLNRHWLVALGAQRGRAIGWLGLVASLSLLAYTLALGHRGDEFHLVRRIGVMGYFGLTFIAQVQLGAALRGLNGWQSAGGGLLRLSLVILLIGLLSVVLGALYPSRYDDMEDGFEWVLALLMDGHALWVALLWRRAGFSMTVSVPPPSEGETGHH